MRSLIIGLFLVTAACGGSVQVMEHSAAGGTIAVSGSDEAARSRADELMRQHCGRYTLVDERPSSGGWQMAYRCEPRDNTTAALAPEARLESAVATR